jgi:carboxypeptidase Taq
MVFIGRCLGCSVCLLSKEEKMSGYSKVAEIYSKINSLNSISGILGWDTATMMPEGSAKCRAEDIAVLGTIANKMLASNRLGELLSEVSEDDCNNEWEKANLRLIKYYRDSVLAIDSDLNERYTKASILCEHRWRVARKENDFNGIVGQFSELVEMVKEIAKARASYFKCSEYDSLIDIYDRGRTEEDVQNIINGLKSFLPDFIKQVVDKQKSWKIHEIKEEFCELKQKELGLYCMEAFGFDFTKGRLDISTHPFCGGGIQDTRITTRYNRKEFLSSLMAVAHETGHAIYQQNLPEEYCRQAVGGSLGMSIHESQSLFMEIQVSRTEAFLEFILPKIKKIFDVSGKPYTVENMYRIVNKVEPSFIRVEADEVTYLAHVILRFELEQEILKGNIKIKELPKIWNEKMNAYLGIKPKNDTLGCLQDTHWYSGMFGYFPSYMLGSMNASQFFTTMLGEVKDVHQNIKNGKFRPITDWLKKNVHSQGSLYSAKELINKVTKKDLDVEEYKSYLTRKFL